ncbi:hypothetical protein JTB14_030367 [Gonioctena quinquepunctata]|nr:hypothetical protein JTB14_030367 [Gonioctena quinquepunctata]
MKAVDTLYFKEPQWILDRNGSGPLFWRRESNETNPRVKFRYDVDVKEFQRSPGEIENETCWLDQNSNFLSTGMSVMICVTITIILPWFIFVSN